MSTTVALLAFIDPNGRVVAAELSSVNKGPSSRDEPPVSLVPLPGHRAMSVDVPEEVLSLSGPDLHRYFSEARIGQDGRLQLPKIRVSRGHAAKK